MGLDHLTEIKCMALHFGYTNTRPSELRMPWVAEGLHTNEAQPLVEKAGAGWFGGLGLVQGWPTAIVKLELGKGQCLRGSQCSAAPQRKSPIRCSRDGSENKRCNCRIICDRARLMRRNAQNCPYFLCQGGRKCSVFQHHWRIRLVKI